MMIMIGIIAQMSVSPYRYVRLYVSLIHSSFLNVCVCPSCTYARILRMRFIQSFKAQDTMPLAVRFVRPKRPCATTYDPLYDYMEFQMVAEAGTRPANPFAIPPGPAGGMHTFGPSLFAQTTTNVVPGTPITPPPQPVPAMHAAAPGVG